MIQSRISRFLSWALRHNPEDAGITLDNAGWANVTDVLHALQLRWRHLNLADLQQVVAEDEKGRFSFSEDGRRIRATYAHSLTIDQRLPPAIPPDELYHGTATQSLNQIKQSGLLRQRRQFVHLTADISTALSIGGRHGTPVAIPIDAAAMSANGHVFYHGAGSIWMTNAVPPAYLLFARLIFIVDKP